MEPLTLSLESLAGRRGRGVRIAVIDSGIHAAHPHVQGISGGIAFDAQGNPAGDTVDRLGHGTAVAAAIREKATHAELLALKVFHAALSTSGPALVAAIRWAVSQNVTLVNLSLGTLSADHEQALRGAVLEASACGVIIVAAAPDESRRWLPGALAGVVAVEPDWSGRRDLCEVRRTADGGILVRASAYPRPIPGVPPERNLKGVSFAVANATGFLALALEPPPVLAPFKHHAFPLFPHPGITT